ncbi:MAG: hypothetical protein NTZ59_11900, partial [Bacteroidetes bacterium]|nr:hypothetical protein [Bacteroidota bacterium]
YQLKQYDSAIIYYKNSARVNNNIIKSYSKIGWGYIRINNLDSAFFYFTKALKMESNNKSALYNMACYYSITKETDSAIAYLEKSIKAGYDDFENIKTDTDLDNIRNTEKFKALIKKYFPNN